MPDDVAGVSRTRKAASWVNKKTEGMTTKRKVAVFALAIFALVIALVLAVSAIKKFFAIKLSGPFEVGHLFILVAGVAALILLGYLCYKPKARPPELTEEQRKTKEDEEYKAWQATGD